MGSWVVEHWLAVSLLLSYAGFLLLNARRAKHQTHSVADYYVGGRRLSGWVVGASFCATFASTNSYVGHAGKGYSYGAPWLLFPVVIALFTVLSWTTVAPRLRELSGQLHALTLPDYLGKRYASVLVTRVAALIVLLASVLYLVAIFKGAGNVLQLFLNVPYEWAIAVTLVVVVLYTSVGGFISVARTDVLQGLLMVAGAGLIFYFVVMRAAQEIDLRQLTVDVRTAPLFDWHAGAPFAVLLGVFFSGSLKLLVDPRQVSRFFALRDKRSLTTGLLVALGGLLLIQFALFPVGLLAHLFVSDVSDTDMIMPMLLARADVFPLWAADALLVAIVAAAMSSMDSVLLVSASVFAHDVLAAPAARGIRVTRIAVVGFALLSAVLALNPPGDIVQITIFSGSLYAACFLPTLLLSLHWSGGHWLAAVGSMLVGATVLIVWLNSGLGSQVHEVFPAVLLSTLTFVGLSRWSGLTAPGWPAAVAGRDD